MPELLEYKRSRETARKSGGVRLPPAHILSASVHAFWLWTGPDTLLTWCGIDVSVEAGGRLTTDLITCLSCPEASLKAFRSNGVTR